MEEKTLSTSAPVSVKRKHTTEIDKAKENKGNGTDQVTSPDHKKTKSHESEDNSGVSE